MKSVPYLKCLVIAALCLPVTAAAQNVLPTAVTPGDYIPVTDAEARLGQLLFWDPILSGNRNISCGTCHHPRFGTSDGVSLDLGEGGIGLGPARRPDPANMPEQRIPRNAPALFNLGSPEFTALFVDGRIETDPTRPSGLRTPLEDEMVSGFASLLSAQTMFPVLSADEMAGHYEENEISTAVRQGLITGPDGAWDRITQRVATIPAYADMFAAAYPEIAAGRRLAFTDISNAIAGFVAFEWRSDSAPFDAWLRGDKAALSKQAQVGAALFYGPAGCAACHSGKFQTDHAFHAMGTPQLGPGKGERFERHQRDTGRIRVTNRPEDAYAFRTPSLRNITVTAPYGHAGAHATLAAFLAYHLNPKAGLASYQPQAILPDFSPEKPDWAIQADAQERDAIARAVTNPAVILTPTETAAILAFLAALEDPTALAGRLGIPAALPSGLPIDR
ncbi:MAG: cytochrome c peroxidase [Paracoccaceae bacterium]|nr:cytochrome c peroxidase [Paracoccaceae bacterium]